MRPPLFVREFTPQEHQALRAGLRSPDAFTLRRWQALLASRQGQTPAQIGEALGCSDQTVRNAIRAFHQEGLAALSPKSSAPRGVQTTIDDAALEKIQQLLRHSPREYGLTTSLWTLKGVAQVCADQRITPTLLSYETIRQALLRLGMSWKRAKKWISSPDPAYGRKKGEEIA